MHHTEQTLSKKCSKCLLFCCKTFTTFQHVPNNTKLYYKFKKKKRIICCSFFIYFLSISTWTFLDYSISGHFKWQICNHWLLFSIKFVQKNKHNSVLFINLFIYGLRLILWLKRIQKKNAKRSWSDKSKHFNGRLCCFFFHKFKWYGAYEQSAFKPLKLDHLPYQNRFWQKERQTIRFQNESFWLVIPITDFNCFS